MTEYDFQEQLKQGQKEERYLDSRFSKWFTITPATMDEQRNGLDRWFDDGKRRMAIEYKADKVSQRTGNAFIETVSVQSTIKTKPGWAYTSCSDYIMYYVLGLEVVYLLDTEELKTVIDSWCDKFPSRTVPNRGYSTIGILVPLDVLESFSTQAISL